MPRLHFSLDVSLDARVRSAPNFTELVHKQGLQAPNSRKRWQAVNDEERSTRGLSTGGLSIKDPAKERKNIAFLLFDADR